MNDFDPKYRKHLQDKIEMGHRVDHILHKAVQNKKAAPAQKSDPHVWQRVLLNLALLAGFIILCVGVFTWDLSRVIGFSGNNTAQIIARVIGVLLLTVVYIRLRTVLHETLFPQVDREVVRTIYKIAPELIKDGFTQEAADIRLNKNAARTWVLVGGFLILLVGGVLAAPSFLNTAIGVVTDDSVGGTIVRIILVAFGIGIWSTIRLLLHIHREYDYLGEVVWRIQHLGHDIHGGDILKKAIPQDASSIIGEKLQAIIRIWNIKGKITPNDLQDHGFTHFRLGRQVPHFISAAMPILGLIGTILGLTVSIGGFEDVLSTNIADQSSFAKSIGVSVGGISTAFYTTLAGTIGMLSLKVFALISGNVYANYLVDMRNILAVEVLPRLKKDMAETKKKAETADDILFYTMS